MGFYHMADVYLYRLGTVLGGPFLSFPKHVADVKQISPHYCHVSRSCPSAYVSFALAIYELHSTELQATLSIGALALLEFERQRRSLLDKIRKFWCNGQALAGLIFFFPQTSK
jgi:hypothetical protein